MLQNSKKILLLSNIGRFLFWAALCLILTLYFTGFAGMLPAPSKTVYSIVLNAEWDDGDHWSTSSGGASCSCTPDESKDVIYIETNTSSSTGLIFGANVNVVVRNNSNLTINGNTTFMNGSVVTVEGGSSLVINGNLVNNNNSDEITVNGTLSVNGNFTGGTGSAISGTGSMSTTGTAITDGTARVFGFDSDCAVGPCFTNSSSPLPVKLVSFTAEYVSNTALLKWTTAVEINNDRFELEKSQNGSDFSMLVKINGAGNSNSSKNYEFIDKDIASDTIYYRLKQIDFDGKSEFFDIKAVSIPVSESPCELIIKPNPCVGKCEISFENCNLEEFQNARFSLFDALGNAVYTSVSKTITNGEAQFEFDNANYLKPAVYIIRGNAAGTNRTKKIIIGK